jgi:D-inositol-3-phosphate glycosyltransferase
VHFLGARPQEQLPLLYAAADIVTMPSHYESFGLATLEGLACGRPVVATAAGGPALIVEDGVSGFLAAPGDHVALAGQLERLLDDDVLRAQMGNRARLRAERFGWPAVTCDIQQVYRETLERATLRPTVTLRQCVRAG